MTPDDETLAARLRALKDFQRHSAEGLEPDAEGATAARDFQASVLSGEPRPERPLGVRVPKEWHEFRVPSIYFQPAHDHDKACNRALSREPNVYVRRARKQLGLRPTGPVYQEDLAKLSPFSRKLVDVVALRASRTLPPKQQSLWSTLSLVLAGAAMLYGLVAGWGRK